jgi:3-isopropylmalate/(R)-2-methylmalate dehydratase small subunit
VNLVRRGRVWKFGDNINTDLIFPQSAFRVPVAEQRRYVFSAVRPGWVDLVEKGDLIVAGRNFGTGSGRTVGKIFSECGIAGLVAESINGLCFRNCINYSFPAMECRGVVDLFEEGDIARIDFLSGVVTNESNGREMNGKPLPPFLADLVQSGGIIPMLVRGGYIDDKLGTSLATTTSA